MMNSNQGIRHNQGKPQWSQIDFKALEPMVRVLEEGGKKVGRDNWKKGLLVRETIESLLRHTFALLAGEDNDHESKQPHIGHILSNAMFISYMLQNRPDMDNRREKVFESSALREAKREVVCNSYHLKGDGAGREKEDPKGGVLDESNFRQIAQDFADRLRNHKEEPPKMTGPMSVCPPKQSRFHKAMQKFRQQPDRGRSLNTLKDFDDWRVDYGKPNLWGMPSLDDHVYWEASGIPNPAISAGQNANIGRSYPKDESVDWDPWADTSISLKKRQ